MIEPSEDSMKRARRVVAWAGNGLHVFLHKLALEIDSARADALEGAAKLCEATRCRKWSPDECAHAIRAELHPATCAMHRWQSCNCARGAS